MKILMLVFLVVTVVAGQQQAPYRSEYIGVYGIVEKVVFEPNEVAPERVPERLSVGVAMMGDYENEQSILTQLQVVR